MVKVPESIYSKGGSSKGSTGSSFWGTAGKGTKATSGGKSGTPSKVHGNSKLSTKPQHGYEIYNTETGDVVKTGISGQKMNLRYITQS